MTVAYPPLPRAAVRRPMRLWDVVLTIVLLARRRLAFWVPLAAAPLVIGGLVGGLAIATAGLAR